MNFRDFLKQSEESKNGSNEDPVEPGEEIPAGDPSEDPPENKED